VVACSSSKTPTHADGSAGLDGDLAAAGATGSGGTTGTGGGAGGEGGVNQGSVPAVVATLDAVPVSLALAGDRLYVTLFPTHGGDGKVESIAKTATDASADAGTAVTTLASGLPGPGAIAVNGSQVLWIDNYQVISVLVTGGPTSTLFNNADIASAVLANVRLPIVNSVFYSTSDNGQTIRAYPLGAADGGIGISTTAFTRSGEGLTYAVDSDGTSLFFLNANGNGSDTPYDLTESPVARSTHFDERPSDSRRRRQRRCGGDPHEAGRRGRTRHDLVEFAALLHPDLHWNGSSHNAQEETPSW
jgi:hypothetical protein